MASEHRLKRLELFISKLNRQGLNTYKKIAEEYNLNASYLSQLINGRRPLGENAARNMENKFGLPRFYFDRSIDNKNYVDVLNSNDEIIVSDKIIKIPLYSIDTHTYYEKNFSNVAEPHNYRYFNTSFFRQTKLLLQISD